MVTMSSKRDYYEILGVARTATREEITQAYRRLALKYHPDRNPGDEEAVRRFKEASEAFEVLSDPEKRARYDRYGHAGLEGGAPQFHDISDIFEAFRDIFQDSIFGDFFGMGRSRGPRPTRGQDVTCTVELSLEEVLRGAEKEVRFQRRRECEHCGGTGADPRVGLQTCDYCRGHGRVVTARGFLRVETTCPACHGQGRQVTTPCPECNGRGAVSEPVTRTVSIPAGIDEDIQLRLAGQGHAGTHGGPAGHCYVQVRIKPHPLFQRHGNDLVCRLPVSYPQAVLGAELEVPTLEGTQTVKIAPGTQPGQVIRLRRQGLPDLESGRRGDLLVEIALEVPRRVTGKQRELLKQLADLEDRHPGPQRKSFFDKLKEYFASSRSSAEE